MSTGKTIGVLFILWRSSFVDLHPLDPLTLSEISQTVRLIEANKFPPEAEYIYLYTTVKEPPKYVLLPYFLSGLDPPDTVYPRKAFVVVTERGTKTVLEVVVSLTEGKIESRKIVSKYVPPFFHAGHVQPNSDHNRAIVFSDYRVRERIRYSGYSVNSAVLTGGSFHVFEDNPTYNGKRLVQFHPCGINSFFDNNYAHPMDFVVIFDWDEEEVVEIIDLPIYEDLSNDNQGQRTPTEEANYDYKLRGGETFLRQDSKINIESPAGPSFSLEGSGRVLSWQNWKMHIGFNAREGIVINHLTYNESGSVRPLMYRGALAEMYVPYGDPRNPFQQKQVFDVGHLQFGRNCYSQILGEDVIGNVKFFHQYFADPSGMPVFFGNNVAITEEDAGILWKHLDFRTGSKVTVRSHRLSVGTIGTIGNYDYGIYWRFYQDGSIEVSAKLTGIVSTNMMATNSLKSHYASTLKSQVNAQYHQHFLTVRLDADIDGTTNSASMTDIVQSNPETGSPGNEYGNAFYTVQTSIRTAGEGKIKISPHSGRFWTISNPNRFHPYTKKPVSWKLVPALPTPRILMKQDCFIKPTVRYFDYEFWVTKFQDDQLYPGGFYLNTTGLPEWVESDPEARVDNTDIVLWHSFGVTHIPRVEDWPIMPSEEVGFWLKPFNYFIENPSINVPPLGHN